MLPTAGRRGDRTRCAHGRDVVTEGQWNNGIDTREARQEPAAVLLRHAAGYDDLSQSTRFLERQRRPDGVRALTRCGPDEAASINDEHVGLFRIFADGGAGRYHVSEHDLCIHEVLVAAEVEEADTLRCRCALSQSRSGKSFLAHTAIVADTAAQCQKIRLCQRRTVTKFSQPLKTP